MLILDTEIEMNRDEMSNKIQAFIEGGGEVTRLRYADQKAQNKAQRMHYHKDKALGGSERSKKAVEHEREREGNFIFSRDERWGE
jgi:hypothetical protein